MIKVRTYVHMYVIVSFRDFICFKNTINLLFILII